MRVFVAGASGAIGTHVPRWLARLIVGDALVMIATESHGASNAKAKRELGWTLRYPSWRQGFVAAYASTIPADGHRAHFEAPRVS